MSVAIEFSGIERTQAIVDYAARRLESLGHHTSACLGVKLKLTVVHAAHEASATLGSSDRAISGLPFHATAAGRDIYAAIDGLVDKLDKHLRRSAGKRLARRRDTVEERESLT